MRKDIQISINYKVDKAVINSPKILLKFDKDCYINSDGLAAIIEIAVEGYKRGQKINACGLSDHFQKIFHLVGLTRFIHIFSSQEDAINDF